MIFSTTPGIRAPGKGLRRATAAGRVGRDHRSRPPDSDLWIELGYWQHGVPRPGDCPPNASVAETTAAASLPPSANAPSARLRRGCQGGPAVDSCRAHARWVFDAGQPTGCGSDPLPVLVGALYMGREPLIVSNGVGNWFPLRVNAPAEIVHLTLRCAGTRMLEAMSQVHQPGTGCPRGTLKVACSRDTLKYLVQPKGISF